MSDRKATFHAQNSLGTILFHKAQYEKHVWKNCVAFLHQNQSPKLNVCLEEKKLIILGSHTEKDSRN